MSKRVDYCKRLLMKAMIIEANLGSNEKEEVSVYIDSLGQKYDQGKFLLDDHNGCKCEKRSDVILIDDTKYCCDCMCHIKDEKDGNKQDKEN